MLSRRLYLKEREREGCSNVTSKKPTNFNKPDGTPCTTPKENADTFHTHLKQQFERDTVFDELFLDAIPQKELVMEAELLPSVSDTTTAIKKLNLSSPGLSGIHRSYWKAMASNDVTFNLIRDFITNFWRSESPPASWNNCSLTILPKKGSIEINMPSSSLSFLPAHKISN